MHRRELNAEQLEVLELLYKFRYGTNILLAAYFGKSRRSAAFKRLSILIDQGLIAKRFDSSYRIRGMSAAYYLLPDGARRLQEHWNATNVDNEINMQLVYRVPDVSEDFMLHCLHIFRAYIALRGQYGDSVTFFPKVELMEYEHFPESLPDAFVTLSGNNGDTHFFLDVLETTHPFFTIIRKINQYFSYEKSGKFTFANPNEPFPVFLLVCQTEAMQKRLRKYIASVMDKELREKPVFATTTMSELASVQHEAPVWQRTDRIGTRLSLGDIS